MPLPISGKRKGPPNDRPLCGKMPSLLCPLYWPHVTHMDGLSHSASGSDLCFYSQSGSLRRRFDPATLGSKVQAITDVATAPE